MTEEIQIGADASQAISELRKLESAVLSSMKAAGASTKETNAAVRGLDKVFAGVAASAVRTSQTVTSSAKAENAAVKTQIAMQEELARARATAATGVKINKAGQAVNANTGRFAGAAASAEYAAQVTANRRSIQVQEEHNRRVLQLEGDLQNRLNAMRNRKDNSTPGGAGYDKRQAELERAFSGKLVGLANPNATNLQKFANVLNQIPPATWTQKLDSATASVMNMSNSMRYALYEVASSATVAGAAFIAFGAFAVNAAVTHERAFANVARTTQTSAEGYAVLERQLAKMSMELPITYEELTNIATAAGQLGIGANGVATFTRTVAQLTATTNLTSDAAGIALARFRTFFSEADNPALAVSEATFSNLASSILKVGVNSIASESGIVNVAVQIASMGDYAGLTANQVIGLAGALSSIGVAPELSRGTITRTFSLIGNAVSENGVKLQEFANLAGVSAEQFSAAWGTEDFVGVFNNMLKGIRDFGGDANLMLQELGFNSVRDRPLLLRLATAADEAGRSGELLTQTLSDAYAGWVENSELALQYTKISTTTSARVQVLGQAFEQLAASLGKQTGGFLGEMAEQLTGIVRGFEGFSNSGFGQVLGTIAVNAGLAVGGLLLLVGGGARVAASLQAVGTAYHEMKDDGVTATRTLGVAFRGLTAAMGIIGLVAGLATVVGGFVAADSAARQARMAIQDMDSVVLSMRNTAKDGGEGIDFYVDATQRAGGANEELAEQAARSTEALYGSSVGAEVVAKGLDKATASADKLKFTFGDVERELVKSQLVNNEAFQNLFKMDTGFDWFNPNTMFDLDTLIKNNLDPAQLNIDDLITVGAKGGDVAKETMRQLMAGLDESDFSPNQWSEMEDAASGFGERTKEVFGGMKGALAESVILQAALESQSAQTYEEIVDGSLSGAEAMSKLDEVTQKTVDGIAKGFASFTGTSNLIKLAQEFAAIAAAPDADAAAEAAAKYEQSWTDAYGGASFSLQNYLDVFGRAGQEQTWFIENLSVLRQRFSDLGIDPAFLNDLAAMGPEGNRLVQALVTGTDEQLTQFESLWGSTGYDSMVMFATQAAIGQELVSNVLRNVGLDGLRTFNDAISSGVGVNEALTALQLDVNGKPIIPAVNAPKVPGLSWADKKLWEEQNRLNTTATVNVSIPTLSNSGTEWFKSGTKVITPNGWAEGGYTGPGGKYQVAGAVHAGEFVMNAEATRSIGVGNLYAMMRAASSGRAAPSGNGYANGGAVRGSGSNVISLSPRDRALLRSNQAPRVIIGNRDIAQAVASANFSTKRQGV